MKALALAVVAMVAVFASCSITHKSDDYACTKTSQCSTGRTCIEGFCVLVGIDASPNDAPNGDANNCPAPCTSCNTTAKTCTIDCNLANCSSTVVCPTGYRCDIQCNRDGACQNGVNCQMGASCNVQCSAQNSCRNVQCGPGPCDVNCTGTQSCRNVRCNNSCACDVLCTGPQSCQATTIFCTSPNCIQGLGCTSVPALCHSCM